MQGSDDSLGKVRGGLRKGTRLIAAYLAAAEALGFAQFYVRFLFYPGLSVLWLYGYLAVVTAMVAAVVGFHAYRTSPRIVGFVGIVSGRLREAEYTPWGMKKRGLLLAFDNGLVMNPMQNNVFFRLFIAPDGTPLRPTLEELPTLLRRNRRAKRRGIVSKRKGDIWMKAELERLCALLGGRRGVVVLFEQPSLQATSPPVARWTAVGIFFIPRWSQRGEALKNAVDDVEKLLAQSRTRLAA